MSHFDFGGPSRSTNSGRPNYSDTWQVLSTTGACPAPVLPTTSQLDLEMLCGLGTNSLDLMDDDDLFSELYLQPLDGSLWAPEVSLPIVDSEEPGDNHVFPDAYQSACAAIENGFIPGTNIVPVTVRRSASVRCKWPNFVRRICLCNRFSYAAAAEVRTRLKGVMEKNGKYVCEMRVPTKMQKEKNKPIPKVWLGTYKTKAQAARALDVGRFFFNGKKIKSFYNPNSETVLSKHSDLLELPLEELVKKVQKLARHYGDDGSVQNFVL